METNLAISGSCNAPLRKPIAGFKSLRSLFRSRRSPGAGTPASVTLLYSGRRKIFGPTLIITDTRRKSWPREITPGRKRPRSPRRTRRSSAIRHDPRRGALHAPDSRSWVGTLDERLLADGGFSRLKGVAWSRASAGPRRKGPESDKPPERRRRSRTRARWRCRTRAGRTGTDG